MIEPLLRSRVQALGRKRGNCELLSMVETILPWLRPSKHSLNETLCGQFFNIPQLFCQLPEYMKMDEKGYKDGKLKKELILHKNERLEVFTNPQLAN